MAVNALSHVVAVARRSRQKPSAAPDVLFGTAGDDTLYVAAGVTAYGGKGDDNYYLWSANATVVEYAGEGVDTVYSSISGVTTLASGVENLVLQGSWSSRGQGNALGNVIRAGSIAAWLDGAGGADVLVGGAGADLFQIRAGNGSDVIEQFSFRDDLVRLDGYGFATFADVVRGATQDGDDVRIALSNGEQLVLRHVALGELSASNFRLADNIVTSPVSVLPGDLRLTSPNQQYITDTWRVVNNAWNVGDLVNGIDYQLSTGLSSKDVVRGTTFVWSFPDIATTPGGGLPVLAYPEIKISASQLMPLSLSALSGLSVAYDYSAAGKLAGFNVSFDIWLTDIVDGVPITKEVMIWLHQGDLGGPQGRVGTFNDGAFAGSIYHRDSGGSGGNAANLSYTAVISEADTSKGTLDIQAIFQRLIALGLLSGHEKLNSLEFGAEVTSGAGSLVVNGLSYTIASAQADGSTIIRTVDGGGIVTFAAEGTVGVTGTGYADTIMGNALDNVLAGGGGDDRLDGAGGANVLVGGAGNDVFLVHSTADTVVEAVGEGNDTVYADVGYALAANIESLVLTGAAAIGGVGNALGNTITGNAANNVLDGGAGADRMIGGAGDDTYVVDDAGDRVVEALAGGNDVVLTSISYTLSAGQEVEILRVADVANGAALYLAGNEFANTLIGGAGANILDGSGGADVMIGGAGSDTYYVDSAGDQVIEAPGGDVDTVVARTSYALAAGQGVEVLRTADANAVAAIDLTGNEFDNYIAANKGRNVLDGGAGNDFLQGNGGGDVLIGGSGDDTMYVNSSDDRVVEAVGGGNDRVCASVSWTLTAGQQVEQLRATDLAGTQALNFTGNEFNDSLIGNAGANILSGGAGDDGLFGGAGDDVLIGGVGLDIMQGDAGSDRFVIDGLCRDAVLDFSGGDILDLTQALAALSLGADAFATGQLRFAVSSGINTVLLYDRDGPGGGQPVEIGYFKNVQPSAFTLSSVVGVSTLAFTNAPIAEVINGTPDADVLRTEAAARHLVALEAGDDVFYSGALFGTGDRVDGGDGVDALVLQGKYSLRIAPSMMAGVERLELLSGVDPRYAAPGAATGYQLTVTDALLAPAQAFVVDASGLQVGETLSFNAAAERDGRFDVHAGAGSDTIVTGAGSDRLDGGGGDDLMRGGAGDDTYLVDSARDRIIETLAGGRDTVVTTLASFRLSDGLEDLQFAGDRNFTGRGNDGVNAITGGAGDDRLQGAGGDDALAGGGGADRLEGGVGADTLSGGAGADVFAFAAGDSAGASLDRIVGLDFAEDKIDLPVPVRGYRLAPSIASDLALDGLDAQLEGLLHGLAPRSGVLISANGAMAGHLLAVFDLDGVAGYRAGADLVLDITGAQHLPVSTDFLI